jgi:hypothetical protein
MPKNNTFVARTCATCEFAEGNPWNRRCHRRSPAARPETGEPAVWPAVTELDWCGDWALSIRMVEREEKEGEG